MNKIVITRFSFIICLLQISAGIAWSGGIKEDMSRPATMVAGAQIAIENMTKIPGTNKGFPANDLYTFHRNKNATNTKGETTKYHDTNVMRIHNTGSSVLNISNFAISSSLKFKVAKVNGVIFTGNYPISISAGSYKDVTIQFIDNSTEKGLKEGTLTIHSNAVNASALKVLLKGTLMLKVESSNEVNAIQIIQAYGFKTSMNGQPRPSSAWPTATDVDQGVHGDLILSKTFLQANPAQPVRAFQLASFKGPGTAYARLTKVSSTTVLSGFDFRFGTDWHQSLLPKLTNTSSTIANDVASSIAEPFRINIDGYPTSGGNPSGQKVNELLGVRVYKVYDRAGKLIPYHYIVIQDYVQNGCGAGTANCDWNDNLYYFMNIKPATDPAVIAALQDMKVQAGVAFTYDVSTAFDEGYPGNKFTYSATLSNGAALPSWISLDASTGKMSGTPPAGASTVTVLAKATDINGIVVFDQEATAFQLQMGSTTVSEAIWLEAECGSVGSNWVKVTNSGASAGSYVSVKSGYNSLTSAPTGTADRLSISFNISKTGSYHISARVKAPTHSDNSFWIRVDGGAWMLWNIALTGSSFAWRTVQNNPFSFTTTGIHTIEFAFREDGTHLDKLFVSSSSTLPTGTGGTAANCGSTARLASDGVKSFAEEGSYLEEEVSGGIEIYPNPSTGIFEIHLPQSHWQGKATVVVRDVQGRLVKELKYVQILPQHLLLDLTGQPEGVYMLQINDEQRSVIRRLIKGWQ